MARGQGGSRRTLCQCSHRCKAGDSLAASPAGHQHCGVVTVLGSRAWVRAPRGVLPGSGLCGLRGGSLLPQPQGCGCATLLLAGALLPILPSQRPGAAAQGSGGERLAGTPAPRGCTALAPADHRLPGRLLTVAERGQLPLCPPAGRRAAAEEDGATFGGEGEQGALGVVTRDTSRATLAPAAVGTLAEPCHSH